MAADLHRNPPFRAEHLGSLLRPHGLLETREAAEKGKASKQQLASAEDEAVQQIVDLQLKLGYRAVSDGEYRRHSMAATAIHRCRSLTARDQCSGALSSLA